MVSTCTHLTLAISLDLERYGCGEASSPGDAAGENALALRFDSYA